MFDFLFDTSNNFKSYTHLHWWPIFIYGLVLSISIWYAKRNLSESGKVKFGVALSLIPTVSVIMRMIFTFIDGTFSIQEELPFHLCRTLALIFPFVMAFQFRSWFGVLYFFTVVGALQALLTPDLPLSAPHHSYWTYWGLHCVLVGLPFYCIVVFGWKVTKRDFWNAVIAGNLYLLFTGLINVAIGSNYFFTAHKPPSPTLIDILGPWPWYLLAVELFAFVMFILVGLPFWVGKKGSSDY